MATGLPTEHSRSLSIKGGPRCCRDCLGSSELFIVCVSACKVLKVTESGWTGLCTVLFTCHSNVAKEDSPHNLQTQSFGVLRANSMRIGQAIRKKFDPGSWSPIFFHVELQLAGQGVLTVFWNLGDAIAIYMPMTTTSIAIYLGIILAGRWLEHTR